MPNVLAQGKTMRPQGTRRLVLGGSGGLWVSGAGWRQVCTRLLEWDKSKSVQLGLCRDNCGANLRTNLQQNSIDLYNGGAKVLSCCLVGSCSTWAVKVESGVSTAIWWDKTQQILHFLFSYNRPVFSLGS